MLINKFFETLILGNVTVGYIERVKRPSFTVDNEVGKSGLNSVKVQKIAKIRKGMYLL